MMAAVESLSQLSTRAKALAVAGAMMAMFTAAMDQTLVGTAMPRIVGSLGGLGLFPWVFTAYMVSSTTVVPIVGRLTDMYGRKPFYLAGIAVLVAGSMLAGLSSSMPQLIAFRALQGIGGGMVMGITFIVVGDLFPPAERSKYVGLFTGVFAAASVLGPLIGGALTDYVHWRWVFYVNFPLGAMAMLAVAVGLPAVRPVAQGTAPDWWGFALLPALVVPLLLALSWGGSRFQWLSLPMASMFGAVALLLILFVVVERRAAWPVLPLSLLGNQVFAVAAAISFLLGTSMFGAISFIPMFVQGVLGASATNSGLITMPLTVALALSSTLGGQVIARLGRYKLVNLLGLAVVALAVYLFSRIGITTARAEVTRNMVILGTGMGLTLPVLTLAVQNAVPYRMLGIATSSIQFIRQVGAVMGVALLGSRLNAVFAQQLAQGMPPELRSLPPEMSSILRNPDFFLSPQRMAALQERFAALGGRGMELFEALLGTVRLALASGIAEAFAIALFLSLPSLALGLLLKEIPLRKAHVVEPERPVLPVQTMTLQGFGDGPSPPDPAPPPEEAELRREVAALREQVAYLRQMAHRRAQAPSLTSLHQEVDALRQELRLLAQELCHLAPGASPAQGGSEEWSRLLEEILREVRSLRESLQGEWRRRLTQH
ncbi:MAG: MFS transporter [Dehalococcoidia bacterium]|jgi:EmrB/QacA subfamily drug resistance transporter|nr:MFS transporter [Dehalococcoidia bacterium]